MGDHERRKPGPKKQDLRVVVVRMPPEMHLAIKARGVVEDRTMAQAIRHAVREYLKTPPSD